MLAHRTAAAEPGSFRDPDSRVFITDDGVYRALSDRGRLDWEALRESAAWEDLATAGKLIATEALEAAVAPSILADGCSLVLRHERIPFVSYPYEWPFGMLKDAALLQLEVLERALADGLMVKDSSPYNVQWRGAAPVFADIGSFERLREREPWVGYRQFCKLFLYPLLLQAYRGVAFHPFLRGSLEGIEPETAAALLRGRDRLRRGVLTHVVLHARLDRRHAADAGRDVERRMRSAGFSTELVRANVRRLRETVERLRWNPGTTAWSGYRDANTYSEDDAAAKARFVTEAVARRRPGLVWDLGCNDGTYARLAAAHAGTVVAVDRDHASVERLYRVLRDAGDERILPLVGDVCDPSPDLGWANAERGSLLRRGRPDLTLCLALVHHIAISGNVPTAEIAKWLGGLGGRVVVEFPHRTDPMVQRLLASKRDGAHPDYDAERFAAALAAHMRITRRERLPGGTRTLFEAWPEAQP
jgi:hypothetical protein